MRRDRLRVLLVVVLMLLQWASAVAISARFDEIDDSVPGDYFVPADITFIVWIVIYGGATLYAIYQALPNQRQREIHRQIGGWLAATYALCATWNITSIQGGRYDSPDFQPIFVGLTVVIIVGMLLTLLQVFIRLRNLDSKLSLSDRLFAQNPALIYFAWINVAVIANTTSALIAFGFNGEPNGALWSAAMIVVAIVLTSAMILYTRASLGTIAYAAVIVWAFVGIYLGNNAESTLVGTLALIGAAVAALVTAFHFWNNRRQSAPVRIPATQR